MEKSATDNLKCESGVGIENVNTKYVYSFMRYPLIGYQEVCSLLENLERSLFRLRFQILSRFPTKNFANYILLTLM